MNEESTSVPRTCRNENCVRTAEPGESYCATCGLELSLFVRDLRPRRLEGGTRRSREAPRA
ncbi:MAG TPA: hypothetical protein VGH97_04245 [Thermoanaerobaculia bacterium]|jgi:hypothetical protein